MSTTPFGRYNIIPCIVVLFYRIFLAWIDPFFSSASPAHFGALLCDSVSVGHRNYSVPSLQKYALLVS